MTAVHQPVEVLPRPETVAGRAPAPAAPPAAARSRVHAPTVAGLAGLVVGSLALRLPGIRTGYWIDEALSVGIARQPLHQIAGWLAADGSPPLWYLLLGGWVRVFGDGEVATHSLSLLVALATIPVAWWAGTTLAGRRAGWIAAVLAAVSPFATYFARETRMYSLVTLLSLLVAVTFVRAFVDHDRRHRWWFALSLVALLYTHNWGLYVVVAAVAGLVLLALQRRTTDVLREAAPVLAVAGVAYLPWLPTLLGQLQNTGAPWSYTPDARDVLRELAALWRDERVLVALGIGAGGGLVPLVRRWWSRDAAAAACLALLVAVPITLGWVVAHVEPSWATRYLAVVVGPLLLLLGIGLSRVSGVGLAAVAVAVLLVLQPFTRLGGGIEHPPDAKSNGRQLAELVGARLRPGDLVVATQPEAVPLLEHYLGDRLRYADPNGLLDRPSLMDWRDAHARLRAATVGEGLAPLLSAMEPGDRLLLVVPSGRVRRTDTEWIQLHRRLGERWFSAIRADGDLVVVDRVRGPRHAQVPLDAVLVEHR